MSAQVAPSRLHAPFSGVSRTEKITIKKRKMDFPTTNSHSSPKKTLKMQNYNEKNTNWAGIPVAPIAPIQNHNNPQHGSENDFLDYISFPADYKPLTIKSEMDNSLLRTTLLSEHGKSEINTEKLSSSGTKFINPKKEFIVKHNKDTTNLRNSQSLSNDATCSDSSRDTTSNDFSHILEEIKANSIKLEESQSPKPMSNMEFWKYLLTLQILMQQASVQLKNMVTKPVEELVSHSLKLVELKHELEPHLGLLENSLRTILNVLPHVEYVEIGSPENTFKVSQQAWEKAYSKTTIKDSALAFLECDLFIPKQTKLSSTAGRSSNSAINGTLKPIDSRILNSLYYTLADRKRMPNIQRTQDNYLASPHFLTAKEQKLVRETLAQYFNQLRQKEKRRSHMSHNIKKEDESY
jgi:hypothetical protein